MKEIKIIIFLFVFISLINTIKSVNYPKIKIIINAELNGTASYISLDDIPQNEKFIYFLFDFEFHTIINTKNSNIALFILTTSLDYQNEKSLEKIITYGFSKKFPVFSREDLEQITWEKMNIISKGKNYYGDFEYFLQSGKNTEEYKSLILRIPTFGKNEGSVSVENVLEFPSSDKSEL